MPTSTLPSLDLVRQVTDRLVLDRLLSVTELTRAEIAAETGVSKPTVSESVRRLVSSGLVTESGRQVGKRGPAGTYFRLSGELGVALAVAAGPAGVVAETYDVRGTRLTRVVQAVATPVDAATLGAAMTATVRAALGSVTRVRGCAVSLAGPVDQDTGRLVRLSYSPFLLDELNPRDLLADLTETAVQVDNDVNWAALAEHNHGAAQDLAHVVHFYLGPGIGAAVVVDGRVVHGVGGLAGELAHVRTTGPEGRSLTLLECFAAWGLLEPGSQAVDHFRLARVLDGSTPHERRRRDEIAGAMAGAIGSVTALLNPQAVLIGGPWGSHPDLVGRVAAAVTAQAAVPTDVRISRLGDSAPLAGARIAAVRAAQESLATTR